MGIFVIQVILGNYGGAFFSVYRDGMSLVQWIIVLVSALLVFPISLITKFLIFKILKLGDGQDELDAVEEEGSNKC